MFDNRCESKHEIHLCKKAQFQYHRAVGSRKLAIIWRWPIIMVKYLCHEGLSFSCPMCAAHCAVHGNWALVRPIRALPWYIQKKWTAENFSNCKNIRGKFMLSNYTSLFGLPPIAGILWVRYFFNRHRCQLHWLA